MNKIIRLAFAEKQKENAVKLFIDAHVVFLQAVENYEKAEENYRVLRHEISDIARIN